MAWASEEKSKMLSAGNNKIFDGDVVAAASRSLTRPGVEDCGFRRRNTSSRALSGPESPARGAGPVFGTIAVAEKNGYACLRWQNPTPLTLIITVDHSSLAARKRMRQSTNTWGVSA